MPRSLQDVGLAVKRLQARHHRALDARLSSLGISLVQWDALRHLSRNPDASLHDLARLTFQSDQAFGALAGRMVERELIERVAGPGRAVHHRITPRGRRLLADASPLVDEVLAASLGALTAPQLDVLGDLLERLVGSADPPG
ncbi:MAG: MarR family winged helix-turn-helix transcriptional regulator [Candidatus Dormibacteria bacterium]|jgi:DNA-binding MarR family transcriptional regulator